MGEKTAPHVFESQTIMCCLRGVGRAIYTAWYLRELERELWYRGEREKGVGGIEKRGMETWQWGSGGGKSGACALCGGGVAAAKETFSLQSILHVCRCIRGRGERERESSAALAPLSLSSFPIRGFFLSPLPSASCYPSSVRFSRAHTSPLLSSLAPLHMCVSPPLAFSVMRHHIPFPQLSPHSSPSPVRPLSARPLSRPPGSIE